MAKYEVDITRAATHTFTVEAKDCKEAIEKAEAEAYNTNWSGFEADYKIDSVLRKN